VSLKQVDRSLLVELKDGEPPSQPAAVPALEKVERTPGPKEQQSAPAEAETALRSIQAAFQGAKREVRWPMYFRNVKQFLKSSDPSFDERRLGFSSIHELVREAQRAGIFRMERDRQGVLRVFPGDRLAAAPVDEPGIEPTRPANAAGIEQPEELVPEAAAPVLPGAEAEIAPQPTPEAGPPAPKPRRSRSASARPRTSRKASTKSTRKAAPAEQA
jgi:hypothetical protein